jgi:lysophospholipase L1-like esterase/uncharacterized coiled-coil protein SlyX
MHHKRGKVCIESCKYKAKKGSHKEEDTVQCIWCQHWTHPSCVGEKNKDIVGVWTCPSCRKVPDLIHLMYNTMEKMREEEASFKIQVTSHLADLQKRMATKDKVINELTNIVAEQNKEISSVSQELVNLRKAMAETNNKISANTWSNFRNDTSERPTLVVGSSIIRDMSPSQLDNTRVVSISGGRIADVAAEIDNTPSKKYDGIVLIVGGNDCDPRDPSTKKTPADLVEQYRSLVRTSKQKARNVTVSSICPRICSDEVKSRIDAVNAGIQILSAEENVNFVDNTPSFYLKDDSVNDAYLLKDGIHLTYRGTNKLAQNLRLNFKHGQKNVCDVSSHKRSQGRLQQNHPENVDESESINGTCTNTDHLDLQDTFWAKARSKVIPNRRQIHRKYPSTQTTYGYGENINVQSGADNTRCYFCYETNHTMRTCRHEKPLVCNTCGAEGHKAKHH